MTAIMTEAARLLKNHYGWMTKSRIIDPVESAAALPFSDVFASFRLLCLSSADKSVYSSIVRIMTNVGKSWFQYFHFSRMMHVLIVTKKLQEMRFCRPQRLRSRPKVKARQEWQILEKNFPVSRHAICLSRTTAADAKFIAIWLSCFGL